jgi:hypothetical protein
MEETKFTKEELQVLFDIISGEAGDYLSGITDDHDLESCIRKFEERSDRKIIFETK